MSDNPPILSSKPLTRGQRRALSAIVLSQRQAQEPILTNQIRRLQATLRRRLLNAGSEREMDEAVSDYAEAYGKAVERAMVRIAPIIDRLLVGEKCVPGMEIKGVSESLRRWLDRYVANRITFVYDTTKNKVREWYAQSEGDYNNFESRLQSQFSPKRAELIARTEMGFIQNTSMVEISKERSFGQPLEITWCASFMTRARPFHEIMDGVTIPEGSRFTVQNPNGGTDMMRYPCDPLCGKPVQVCNCRCYPQMTLANLGKF